MTYRANSLERKLDRFAEFTGMPALARRVERNAALPFRFLPLVPLAMAALGLFLQIRVTDLGWTAIMSAWITAQPLFLTGPLRRGPGSAHDERERALLRLGQFAGVAAVAVAAIGGCFLFGILSALSTVGAASVWVPHRIADWFALGFFLIVLHSCVAVLVVSWAIPRVPETDEG